MVWGGWPPTLQILPVTKNGNGDLVIPSAITVSNNFIGGNPHSGAGNKCITIGNLTHIVWAGNTIEPGFLGETPVYAVTYNHSTGLLGSITYVGSAGPIPDSHCNPALTVDSQNYLHVVLGGHGTYFKYSKSTSPNSTSGWTAAQSVSPADTGTYVSLVCDANDNLHMAYRRGGPYDDEFACLGYTRKKPGQNYWEPTFALVNTYEVSDGITYTVYYHKLNIDRQNRLFLNYTIYKSIRSEAEYNAYVNKWPEDPLVAWNIYSPYGYNNQTPHDPVILVSDDEGNSWRVALTTDFQISAASDCREYKNRGGPLPQGDLNKDCRVNLLDISKLAESWMDCTHPTDPACNP